MRDAVSKLVSSRCPVGDVHKRRGSVRSVVGDSPAEALQSRRRHVDLQSRHTVATTAFAAFRRDWQNFSNCAGPRTIAVARSNSSSVHRRRRRGWSAATGPAHSDSLRGLGTPHACGGGRNAFEGGRRRHGRTPRFQQRIQPVDGRGDRINTVTGSIDEGEQGVLLDAFRVSIPDHAGATVTVSGPEPGHVNGCGLPSDSQPPLTFSTAAPGCELQIHILLVPPGRPQQWTVTLTLVANPGETTTTSPATTSPATTSPATTSPATTSLITTPPATTSAMMPTTLTTSAPPTTFTTVPLVVDPAVDLAQRTIAIGQTQVVTGTGFRSGEIVTATMFSSQFCSDRRLPTPAGASPSPG